MKVKLLTRVVTLLRLTTACIDLESSFLSVSSCASLAKWCMLHFFADDGDKCHLPLKNCQSRRGWTLTGHTGFGVQHRSHRPRNQSLRLGGSTQTKVRAGRPHQGDAAHHAGYHQGRFGRQKLETRGHNCGCQHGTKSHFWHAYDMQGGSFIL